MLTIFNIVHNVVHGAIIRVKWERKDQRETKVFQEVSWVSWHKASLYVTCEYSKSEL